MYYFGTDLLETLYQKEGRNRDRTRVNGLGGLASSSWTEWHTRGRQKDVPGIFGIGGYTIAEDAEDDDADTCMATEDQGSAGGRWFDKDRGAGDAEDAEPEHDAEREEGELFPVYGTNQDANPEPPKPWIDRRLMKPHRDRIRSERCEKVTYGGTNGGHRFTEYRLKDRPGIYRPV
jgi:hypothetical protein